MVVVVGFFDIIFIYTKNSCCEDNSLTEWRPLLGASGSPSYMVFNLPSNPSTVRCFKVPCEMLEATGNIICLGLEILQTKIRSLFLTCAS